MVKELVKEEIDRYKKEVIDRKISIPRIVKDELNDKIVNLRPKANKVNIHDYPDVIAFIRDNLGEDIENIEILEIDKLEFCKEVSYSFLLSDSVYNIVTNSIVIFLDSIDKGVCLIHMLAFYIINKTNSLPLHAGELEKKFSDRIVEIYQTWKKGYCAVV
jgi:hypothetical protein